MTGLGSKPPPSRPAAPDLRSLRPRAPPTPDPDRKPADQPVALVQQSVTETDDSGATSCRGR
jgi:hypothetical protein